MHKIWKIVQREYKVRVLSRNFIITTLLTPIAFAALLIGTVVITEMTKDSEQQILLVDESGNTSQGIEDQDNMIFTVSQNDFEQSKEVYQSGDYTMLIYIPPLQEKSKANAQYLSKKKIGINAIYNLEEKLQDAFQNHKRAQSMIPDSIFNSLDVKVVLENRDFIENNNADAPSKIKTMIGTMLGGIVGFMMYIVIFLYGTMILRSVMEEKNNRIVEVIISSVKPFQLMLGKLIGVSLVGLTQLLFWLIAIPIIMVIAQSVLGGGAGAVDMATINTTIDPDTLSGLDPMLILNEVKSLPWQYIIPIFIFFFIGGYFLYASLYAAVGSAMGDDMGESQSLMVPIMIPVILAGVMLFPIIEDPHGNLAVFASIFPLFSPIIMPARLAFSPPIWQVLLSMILLIITVIGCIWLAGRIYRVGILMYGKKVTFKEIGKWVFRG